LALASAAEAAETPPPASESPAAEPKTAAVGSSHPPIGHQAGKPAGTSSPRTALPVAPSVRAPAAEPQAKNCDPPYVFDKAGIKRYKDNCL
jgi:hypothetical protein